MGTAILVLRCLYLNEATYKFLVSFSSLSTVIECLRLFDGLFFGFIPILNLAHVKSKYASTKEWKSYWMLSFSWEMILNLKKYWSFTYGDYIYVDVSIARLLLDPYSIKCSLQHCFQRTISTFKDLFIELPGKIMFQRKCCKKVSIYVGKRTFHNSTIIILWDDPCDCP